MVFVFHHEASKKDSYCACAYTIVISTQFNLNCIFRIDLIHFQQKSLQEYVGTTYTIVPVKKFRYKTRTFLPLNQ